MLDILLVDDETEILESISEALSADGHRVRMAADGSLAQAALVAERFDLLVCDMRLPGSDGMSIFRHARAAAPNTDIIFITAFGGIAEAVAALREGASDYLTKPFRLDELRARISQIDKSRRLRKELALARAALRGAASKTQLIGRSPLLRRTLDRIETFGDCGYAILITGESGTGKELVARMLHETSPRRRGPLVAVNCAAFPDTLIEAELFGYRRGAFTGAAHDRIGRFEAAHGGSLLLDEVAEMPLATQAKLLRVLQEGTIEPLGSNTPIRVDVRVLSATHRDLRDRVAQGSFREDLYYRLKVLAIDVPPLRDRPEDLPLLIEHFLSKMPLERRPIVAPRALAQLRAHPFPGNVRELEHAIQHAAVLARGRDIDLEHLPEEIMGARPLPAEPPTMEVDKPLHAAQEAFEREYVARALRQSGGRKAAAAALLGISRKNLWQKLRRLGLDPLDTGRLAQ